MTRQQCKEDVKRWQKDSATGGQFFSVDILIDKIFSYFEVNESLYKSQLKIKDKEILNLKNEIAFWKDDADKEKLGVIIDCLTGDCNKKDKEIRTLKILLMQSNIGERKASSTVAMLFWKWHSSLNFNSMSMRFQKCTREEYIFRKAYAMLKDNK